MKLSNLLISLAFVSSFAYSATFKVKDVRVEGLQRITAGSFFNYLPVKRGSVINDADFPQIIRQLYQTGFFENVKLYRDGNVLVVDVDERPVIGQINLSGNNDIKDKALLKGLVSAGLGEGDAFDVAKLGQVEKELLNLYYSRSKFDVIIDATSSPLGNNRVALNVNIQEGISARIKKINIIGNKAFSESRLLELFKQTTSKWHSLLTKGDRYSGDKLRGDVERLEAYYQDRGYLDFSVESTQVSLTDDKKYVYITISLSEGLPYRVSGNTFPSSDIISDKQLKALLEYGVGDYYSRKAVRESQQNIKNAFGDKGYAFANVQIRPQVDKANQEVDLIYSLNPGKKAYVRRIEFKGNYKTNDEVLRRELRQMESAAYSHEKLERSTERLQRLSYISKVKRTERIVDGHPDQVDVVYELAESSSRNVTAGIGYGSSSGVLFNAGYETANFFGTGNAFKFDFSTSSLSKAFAVKFTDPYFTVDGVSRTIDLYYQRVNESKANIGDWSSDNWGAFLRFGFPISEYESFSVGGGYRGIKIKTGDSVTSEITNFLAKDGTKYHEFMLDFNWTHDTRDNTVFTNKGSITRLHAELATPGSTKSYYKLGARNRSYFQLNEKLLFSVRGDVSYGDGLENASDGLPFYRKYYAGGLTTVRGFESNTLGPRWSNGDVKGGNLRVTGGAEIILPWHLGQEEETVRTGAFVDFGNVYDKTGDFDASEFRYSAGAFLLWRSPIGPLNMSYAVPLNEKAGDQLEKFQFTIGVPL